MVEYIGVVLIVMAISLCTLVHVLLCNIMVLWIRSVITIAALRRSTWRDLTHWWMGRIRSWIQPFLSNWTNQRDVHQVDESGVFLGNGAFCLWCYHPSIMQHIKR